MAAAAMGPTVAGGAACELSVCLLAFGGLPGPLWFVPQSAAAAETPAVSHSRASRCLLRRLVRRKAFPDVASPGCWSLSSGYSLWSLFGAGGGGPGSTGAAVLLSTVCRIHGMFHVCVCRVCLCVWHAAQLHASTITIVLGRRCTVCIAAWVALQAWFMLMALFFWLA